MQVKLLIAFEIDTGMRWNRPGVQPSFEERGESVERHMHVN